MRSVESDVDAERATGFDAHLGPSEHAARDELRTTLPGQRLLDILHMEEFRATVRAVMTDHDRSFTRIASEIGVSKTLLQAFLDGADLNDAQFNRFAAWCGDKHVPYVPAESVALTILAAWHAHRDLAGARRRIAVAVFEGYREKALNLPRQVWEALGLVSEQ